MTSPQSSDQWCRVHYENFRHSWKSTKNTVFCFAFSETIITLSTYNNCIHILQRIRRGVVVWSICVIVFMHHFGILHLSDHHLAYILFELQGTGTWNEETSSIFLLREWSFLFQHNHLEFCHVSVCLTYLSSLKITSRFIHLLIYCF